MTEGLQNQGNKNDQYGKRPMGNPLYHAPKVRYKRGKINSLVGGWGAGHFRLNGENLGNNLLIVRNPNYICPGDIAEISKKIDGLWKSRFFITPDVPFASVRNRILFS